MNTHFDHRGRQARLHSAQLLIDMLADWTDLPAIVTGDLNAAEQSPPLQALLDGGLRDSFRVVHPDSTSAGTFSGFRGRTDGAKIDYVLCSDAFAVEAAWIDRTRTPDGRAPSDHYPVGAVLRLDRARLGRNY